MANQPIDTKKGIATAMEHHAHAGHALKAGDAAKAMHHIGHMMLALKPKTATKMAPAASRPAPGRPSITSRPNTTMASTPYAAGTDTGAGDNEQGENGMPEDTDEYPVQQAPSKGKTSAVFGAMKSRGGKSNGY